jgi:xanthine dehydrogenase/oxidase
MAMYGLLKKKGAAPTVDDVEQRFQGNICRCTGYRPIYKAMREVIGGPSNAAPPPAPRAASSASAVGATGAAATAVTAGKHEKPGKGSDAATIATATATTRRPTAGLLSNLALDNGMVWVNTTSLQEVFAAIQAVPALAPYRLVVGNTSIGVTKCVPLSIQHHVLVVAVHDVGVDVVGVDLVFWR